jgi:cysteinyl-tRNA synthetase
MGKSYNNVIKLTELFSGDHPLLEKAYSPMTIRFFILQTHYRSTLDFGNEALIAAEKGLKRLMEAYEWLQQYKDDRGQRTDDSSKVQSSIIHHPSSDKELDEKVVRLLAEFDDFINDDFNTAKVLANMFELVPVINSIKDKQIKPDALSGETLQLLQSKMKTFVEDIMGLQAETVAEEDKLRGVMKVLIDLRKEARAKKDWATSDKIRNQLAEVGIQLKDDKDGNISWSLS